MSTSHARHSHLGGASSWNGRPFRGVRCADNLVSHWTHELPSRDAPYHDHSVLKQNWPIRIDPSCIGSAVAGANCTWRTEPTFHFVEGHSTLDRAVRPERTASAKRRTRLRLAKAHEEKSGDASFRVPPYLLCARAGHDDSRSARAPGASAWLLSRALCGRAWPWDRSGSHASRWSAAGRGAGLEVVAVGLRLAR